MAADDDFTKIAAKLNEYGPAIVRARLENREFNDTDEKHARHWLHAHDERRNEERAAQAERTVAAAEKAALAAEMSARWTFWAAIIALTTTVAVALTAYFAWLLN